MSYSERFTPSRQEEKPACYGEVSKYSTDDPECRVCPFKGSCKMYVERKIIAADAGNRTISGGNVVKPGYTQTTATPNTGVSTPAPAAQRLAATPEDSFFEALMHNGSLSAVESVMREAVFAVQSIPRRSYPVPFWLRKK